MEPVAFSVGSKLTEVALRMGWKWLRRRLLPDEKITQCISIEIPGHATLQAQASQTPFPYMGLYVKVVNFNAFDLVMDRLIADFSLGELRFETAWLKPHTLPGAITGRQADPVYFRHNLSPQEGQHLLGLVRDGKLNNPANIQFNGVFRFEGGEVTVARNLTYDR